MIVKLLTEDYLEFLTLTGGCRGSSESTLIKMPHCWKSHALALIYEYWLITHTVYVSLLFYLHFCTKKQRIIIGPVKQKILR